MKPFAVTLYTLRDLLTTPSDIAAHLPGVKAVGYDYVQVSGVSGASGRELRSLLDASKLTCIATHCTYQDATERPEVVFEQLAALGAQHTAVASLPGEFRSADGYRRAGEALALAAAEFARHGYTLSYHNHAFEFERYDGRTGFELVFERASGVGMEFDVFWLTHAGCDPALYVSEFAGPMPLIHLKDKAIESGEPVMAEVGHGNLNWPAILGAAKAKGVEWYIVEQDTCSRPPLESVALSLRYLKSL
jgi:sugar phosphate isomerase/epimerase